MSIIIDVFIVVYLTAIVLMSILCAVWLGSLIFRFTRLLKRMVTERLQRYSSYRLWYSADH